MRSKIDTAKAPPPAFDQPIGWAFMYDNNFTFHLLYSISGSATEKLDHAQAEPRIWHRKREPRYSKWNFSIT